MFTGIVKGAFSVCNIEKHHGLHRITVLLTTPMLEGVEKGASIAVNGCCLTVVEFDQESVSFDVMQETLSVTNLGALITGQKVSIERAARFGDEIGGHLLSGHIHDVVDVADVIYKENNVTVVFKFDARWQAYLMPKGYVSLNGCSLTIGEQVENNHFCVHLIPETLRLTTFGEMTVGAKVNLEIDSQTQAIVETVNRYMDASLVKH